MPKYSELLSEQDKRQHEIIKHGIKQQVAGLGETFLGSPKAEGLERLVPTFGFDLYGLVGTGIEAVIGKDIPYVKRAQEISQATRKRVDELVSTTPPKNIIDTLNRIAPTVLLPGPKVTAAKTKPEALKNLITELALPASQIQTKTGVAAAVTIPTVIVEGIQIAQDNPDYTDITELGIGTKSVMPEREIPKDLLEINANLKPVIVSEKETQMANVPADLLQLNPNLKLVGEFDESTRAEVPPDLLKLNPNLQSISFKSLGPLTPEDQFINNQEIMSIEDSLADDSKVESQGNKIAPFLYAAAAILAGAGGYKYYKARKSGASVQDAELAAKSPIGEKEYVSDITSPATKFVGEIVRKEEPILKLHEKLSNQLNDTTSYQKFRDKIQTSYTIQALAKKSEITLTTGMFPESNIIMKQAPAVTLESIAKLPEPQYKGLADAMIYGTKIDDMIESGVNTWKTTSGAELTLNELIKRYNNLITDPQINKAVVDIRNTFEDVLAYKHEQGTISTKLYDQLLKEKPNYAPLKINYQAPTEWNKKAWKKLSDTLGVKTPVHDDALFNFLKRDVEGGVKAGEAINPVNLLEDYINQSIVVNQHNQIRSEIFGMLERTGAYSKQFKELPAPTGRNVISYYKDGVEKHWRVEDDSIYSSLLNNPSGTLELINLPRKVFTNLTTGKNPFFLPKSLQYEITTALFTRQKGQRQGLADEILGKLGHEKGVSGYLGVDPSIIFSPITGFAKGTYSDFAKAQSKYFNTALRTKTGLHKYLGDSGTKYVAERFTNIYLNSSKHLLEKYSGANAMWAEAKNADEVRTLLTKAAPNFFDRMRGHNAPSRYARNMWRFYSNMVENIHNSIRIQTAAANIAKDKSFKGLDFGVALRDPKQRKVIDEKLTKIAAETRRQGIDLAQQGRNPAWRYGVNQQMAYGNTAVQVMYGYYKALKENPKQFSVGLATLIGGQAALLHYQFQNDPEAAKKYYSKTLSERMAATPIYVNGNEVASIAHEPMVMLPLIYTSELIGDIFGYRTGAKQSIEDTVNGMFSNDPETQAKNTQLMTEALSRVVPDVIGPTAGAILAGGFGADPSTFNLPQGRTELSKGYSEQVTIEGVTGDGSQYTEGLPYRMELVNNEILGAVAMSVNQAAMTFGSLYEQDGEWIDKAGIALENGFDAQVKRLPVSEYTLFGIDPRVRIDTFKSKYTIAAQDTIKEIQARFPRQFLQAQMTGKGIKSHFPEFAAEESTQILDPTTGQMVESKLGAVLLETMNLQKMIRASEDELRSLNNQKRELPSNPFAITNKQTYRTTENRINERIKDLKEDIFNVIRMHEDAVSKSIQEPFTFSNAELDRLQQEPW